MWHAPREQLDRGERLELAGLLDFSRPEWLRMRSCAVRGAPEAAPKRHCRACLLPLSNGGVVGDDDSECADLWWSVCPTTDGSLWEPGKCPPLS
jgi:hypothetical protein